MKNFNPETIGSIGIIFFAFLISVSLFHQAIKIYKERNGETVIIKLNSYFISMQLVVFIYGIKTSYAPVIFNGVSGFLGYLAILIMLYKFKGFNYTDKKIFITMIFFALVTVLLPNSQIIKGVKVTYIGLYYILSSSSLLYFFKELINELFKRKKRGALSLFLLVSYLAANTFWLIFAIAVNDWPLTITSVFSTFLVIGAIVLWFRST